MKNLLSIIMFILLVMVGVVWSETANELCQKGYEAYEARNYEEAIELYKRAISIEPTSEAHFNLGVAYNRKGMLNEAISEYYKAISIDADNMGAHNNLGRIYFSKGMTDEAIEEFKKSVAIDPDFVMAHYNLGFAYYYKGMLNDAIDAYKRVISIDPGFMRAYYDLGRAYGKEGSYILSIKNFYKAGILYIKQRR